MLTDKDMNWKQSDASPTDYRLVKMTRPMRFNGRNWDLFGDLLAA